MNERNEDLGNKSGNICSQHKNQELPNLTRQDIDDTIDDTLLYNQIVKKKFPSLANYL